MHVLAPYSRKLEYLWLYEILLQNLISLFFLKLWYAHCIFTNSTQRHTFSLTLEKNFLSNSSEILGTMLGEILSELFSVKLMCHFLFMLVYSCNLIMQSIMEHGPCFFMLEIEFEKLGKQLNRGLEALWWMEKHLWNWLSQKSATYTMLLELLIV